MQKTESHFFYRYIFYIAQIRVVEPRIYVFCLDYLNCDAFDHSATALPSTDVLNNWIGFES